MKTYVGPWRDVRGTHSPPIDPSSLRRGDRMWWLDLRPTAAMAKSPGNQDADNMLICAVPDYVNLDSAWMQVGAASPDGVSQAMSTRDQASLQRVTGYAGELGTVRDWLWDYVTVHPSGDGGTINHYLPDATGRVSLSIGRPRPMVSRLGPLLGGTRSSDSRLSGDDFRRANPRVVWDRTARDMYRARVLDVVRKRLATVIDSDEIRGRKVLWHQAKKYGVDMSDKAQWERLLFFRFRSQIQGPLHPTTTYGPLTFTDSDGVGLATHDANWTVQAGTWQIKTNTVAATVQGMAYYSSFADDDMTVSQTHATGGLGAGPAVRCSTSATTCYTAMLFNTTTCQIKIISSGTPTFLASVLPNQAFSAARVNSFDMAGTSLTCDYGTSTGNTTHSGITGNDYPGVYQGTGSSVAVHDDWEATDNVASSNRRRRFFLGVS